MSKTIDNLDEKLLALELGWLSDAESKDLRARLQQDPSLAKEYETVRLLIEGLSSLGAEILEEPLPPAMQTLLADMRDEHAKTGQSVNAADDKS